LEQFAEIFNVWSQSIQKWFEKTGVTRKKTFTYSEKSEAKREVYLIEIEKTAIENHVYVSGIYVAERGIREDLAREYRRVLRGVKAEGTKRAESLRRVIVVAAVIHSNGGTKRVAPECYQGSMKGECFERWMGNIC
jgi:hypothetical protein